MGIALTTWLLASRRASGWAAPTLSIKTHFPGGIWRLYLHGGRTEQACPKYSAMRHQLLLGAAACVGGDGAKQK